MSSGHWSGNTEIKCNIWRKKRKRKSNRNNYTKPAEHRHVIMPRFVTTNLFLPWWGKVPFSRQWFPHAKSRAASEQSSTTQYHAPSSCYCYATVRIQVRTQKQHNWMVKHSFNDWHKGKLGVTAEAKNHCRPQAHSAPDRPSCERASALVARSGLDR